jgi:phosphoserine phosphatase
MPLRLAIFDLDGTLKAFKDPYLYLHEELGTLETAQAFTGEGMAGEMSYEAWLSLDASLWKGVERSAIESLFRQNPYLPGARETVAELKSAGIPVAVVSTGLRIHAEQVQADLDVDSIVANELIYDDGQASGEALAHVPEGGKGPIVAQLQAEFGVTGDECLAVGDGISDIDMFVRVRVGVAVNPSSERVRAAASLVLEKPDLSPLLAKVEQLAPGWNPASLIHRAGTTDESP